MTPASAAASAARYHLGILAQAALIAAIVVALTFAGALVSNSAPGGADAALAGRGKPGATPQGSCSVAPNPTTVGEIYTVSASGLPAGKQILVEVSDSVGTMSLFTASDASGNATARGYAYWAGTSTVRVIDNTARKMPVVATCSFTVS